MSEVVVKVLPWGNSYGLRIRRADAERLGLKPGQEIRCQISDFTKTKDLSHWPVFKFGRGASLDHDEGFDEL